MPLLYPSYILELRDPGDSNRLLGILGNAVNITHHEKFNSVCFLSFDIPADDNYTSSITKAHEIWLREYTTETLVQIFRVKSKENVRRVYRVMSHVECASLESQLGDEWISGYEAADTDVEDIIDDLIALQVITPNISKGTIDSDILNSAPLTPRTRSLSIPAGSIWGAFLALRNTYGGYMWVATDRGIDWDITTPSGSSIGQTVRVNKNMISLKVKYDYSQLFNRIYAFGAVEGGVRLELGSPGYVEDATSQSSWGILPTAIYNNNITDATDLDEWADLYLADHKNPPTTYTVDVVDLYEIDKSLTYEEFEMGDTILLVDEDMGVDVSVMIVERIRHKMEHLVRTTLVFSTVKAGLTTFLNDLYTDKEAIKHDQREYYRGCELGENVSKNNILYFKGSDSKWYKASNAAEETTKPTLAVALAAGSSGDIVKLVKQGQLDTGPTANDGTPVFLSTAGGWTTTAPSGGDQARIIGYVKDNTLYFLPENDWVETK